MTDNIALIRKWLDVTTLGTEEQWRAMVTDDVVMRFPYVPAPYADEIRGVEATLKTFKEVWAGFESFEWYDVETKKFEGEELYMSHAKSRAMRKGNQPYGNTYLLITRIRDGRIAEYTEYFNPNAH